MKASVKDIEGLLKALADTTRLRIVGLLAAGEVCVCHIHESLRIPQPKASRHLAYLRRAGIVETRKNGLWVYYRLADLDSPVLAVIAHAVRHAIGHADADRKDLRRLEKLTGCCAPAVVGIPSADCCSPTAGIAAIDVVPLP
jgi:ArsR family transcriptional regulator